MAPKNFNYTVEWNKGVESLKQGRLRQAEQSFKYLVSKFPGAEGGYRGLAKVHFEQDERTDALKILREGAAALTKAGDRSGAIGLLREAIGLDPRDLATHRRLAAALALVGDPDAAVAEYARFVRDLRDNGERERATSEVAYAKGQLRGVAGLESLDAILEGAPTPEETTLIADEPAAAEPAIEERAETPVPESAAPEPIASQPRAVDPWSMPRPERKMSEPAAAAADGSPDDPWFAPPPLRYERSTPAPQLPEIELENDPWSAGAPSSTPAWSAPEAEPEPIAGFDETVEEVVPPAAPPENGEPSANEDPVAVEAAAAQYLATRDPRGATKALEVARYYIDEGRTDAASDLLLQLISAGVAEHDAQRLLIEITRTLGKRDVTKTKCQLLVQALLLDGRNDLAAEVEAMAAD